MNILKTQRSVALLILVAGLLGGVLLSQEVRITKAAAATAPDAAPLTIPDPVELSTAFSKLARQLEPSVVQVTSTIEQKVVERRGQRGGQPDADDLFRRFFGGDPFGNMPAPQQRRAEGTGSGFVVDSHGYILTNNHVVEGATKIQVKLHGDITEYTAKVVGTDAELDLAVIKIDAGHPLEAVKTGNSDAVQVGEWAVAIGSPFGLEATVTAGIISAKGRDLGGGRDHQLQRFLQTDAAINPGNSGGPLLNIRGEVIGVNTMIATSSGASAGVGFALPINMAVNAYNQIIKTGKVARGAIGIEFQRLQKPELLKAYGASEGVFVDRVTPGTPAAKAGLKEGDVITSFNGKPVANGDDLVALVSQTPVGSEVPITVLRESKPLNLTIGVADRGEMLARDNGGPGGPGGDNGGPESQNVKFGISVRTLRQEDRDSANFQESGGVLVAEVESGSFGEDLGLQRGDVLMAINRQAVNSADDVKRIAGTLKPGQAVAFKVMRNLGQSPNGAPQWQPLFLAGTLPASQ
jgi:serine protease Do